MPMSSATPVPPSHAPPAEPVDLSAAVATRVHSVAEARTGGDGKEGWRLGLAAAVTTAVWIYLGALLIIWGMMHFGGDGDWLPTILVYGPRQFYALPLVVLAPLALICRWRFRNLWRLGIAAAVALGPLVNWCVPWYAVPQAEGPRLRVLSLNTWGGAVADEDLVALASRVAADVVLLQEARPRYEEVWSEEWQVRRSGGLLVASRWPIVEDERLTKRVSAQGTVGGRGLLVAVDAPFGRIAVCNVHMRTPLWGLTEVLDPLAFLVPEGADSLIEEIAYRRAGSEQLVDRLAGMGLPLVIGGDFNMTTDSRIYRAFWSRYTDAFLAAGWGPGFTKWTPYSDLDPEGHWDYELEGEFGTRIDHVLVDGHWAVARARVEEDVGSDHRPVFAEVVFLPKGTADQR